MLLIQGLNGFHSDHPPAWEFKVEIQIFHKEFCQRVVGIHGRDYVEPYTLTIMNIVSKLYEGKIF